MEGRIWAILGLALAGLGVGWVRLDLDAGSLATPERGTRTARLIGALARHCTVVPCLQLAADVDLDRTDLAGLLSHVRWFGLKAGADIAPEQLSTAAGTLRGRGALPALLDVDDAAVAKLCDANCADRFAAFGLDRAGPAGWHDTAAALGTVLSRHGHDAEIWISRAGARSDDASGQLRALAGLSRAPVSRAFWAPAADRGVQAGLLNATNVPRLAIRQWARGGPAALSGLERSVRRRPSRAENPVVITGGAGFVGTNLADRLAQSGHPVLVYDTLDRPGVEENLGWLQDRHGEAVQAVLADIRTLALLGLSAALIAANWWLFIFAVNNGQVLEVSLGYFINPLMHVAVGVFIARERFGPLRAAAVALAALGVINQIVIVGAVPVIALILAVSFTGYGYLRKTIAVDGRIGLFWETVIISVPSLIALAVFEARGGGHFTGGLDQALLLILTGPMTVAPLLLFIIGARGLHFATIGILQFIAPSIQFAIGLATGEAFSPLHLVTFLFIWAGLAVFVADLLRFSRKTAKERPAP